MDFFILSRDSISMPETEEKKKAMKPKRKSEKKKTKKSKKEEPKETAKVPQFRVLRANTSGQQLAVELARQQFAAVQQERDKAERDRREEQQRQKQYMDELKAEAEKQKRAAEKFSKAYESTSLNVLDLYRSLSKDPESFKKEQDKLVENTNRFRDVLTSVGMNPDVAQIKATEASLEDLLERRQAEEKRNEEIDKVNIRNVTTKLIEKGWPEEVAKKLAENDIQRANILFKSQMSGGPPNINENVKKLGLESNIYEIMKKEYKKRGWTADEIDAKVSYGYDLRNLNFDKPTQWFNGRQLPQPMVEESSAEKESPLPSGSEGPPPLMKETAPAPFPPVPVTPVASDTLFNFPPPEEAPPIQPPPPIRKQKVVAPELPPALTPITKAGSDYWTRVITDRSISTARLPPEEKEEIPPYQTPQYTAPKKKTPGREYRLHEPITYYDPTNPVLPSPSWTAERTDQEGGTVIPFQENALLAGLKRTLRGDREPRPVEEQPVRRYPRVDTEPIIQGLPPAFGGGGGGGGGGDGAPPLVFE